MADKNGDPIISLNPNQVIGNYRVEKRIGSGGMGDVYRAIDLRLNRPVALKTLRPEYFDDQDKISRFTREAVTAAKINHPNIMSIYDVGEEQLNTGQQLQYIVLEFVEGKNIGSYVRDNNIGFPGLLRLCEKIGSALAEAHRLGIVHRDIKLENIMVNDSGEPKVLDFGLAKPVAGTITSESEEEGATESIANELTRESRIVGTVSYMSPEQARGEIIDHRSDIFSFGILVYQLITGKLPFEGENRVSIIAKILEAPHEPVRSIDETLPAEFERIINKCLQKRPEDRYQDTRDLVVDIRSLRRQFDSNISDSASVTFTSTQLPKAGRRKLLGVPIPVAFAALALILIVAAFSLFKIFDISPQLSKNIQENALAILSFENLSDPNDTERLGQILQELVLTDLADNAPIKLISSQRLFDVRKNLGYKDRTGISPDIASEVASAAGAQVMLSGNLIRQNDTWIVTSQLVDVDDGTIINSHRLEGADVFSVVDDLSNLVRADLAETGIEEIADASVKDKTSVSMEAFRYYFAGIDDLNEHDYEKAISRFQEAIAIDPQFGKAYYQMAIAQWWLEDEGSVSGQKSIQNILDNKWYSSERERDMAMGALALMEKRYGDAIDYYEKLTGRYVDDKEAWYGLGEALFHFGNQTRPMALDAFERAIELDIGFILAYRHVFDLYFENGQYDKAFEKANDLIDAKPESTTGYRYLAKSAVFKGDEDQVRLSLERAVRHHSTPAELQELYYQMFLAYARNGSLQKAQEFAQMTFGAAPELKNAHRSKIWGDLIRLSAHANQSEKVDSLINVALTSDLPASHKSSFISNLVQGGYSNLKTRNKAREVLRLGLAMDTSGTNAQMWAVAGHIALSDRNYELAGEYAQKALALGESDFRNWARSTLFSSYLYSQKYDRALKLAHQIINDLPNQATGYINSIEACVYSGQHERADSILNVAFKRLDIDSKKTMVLQNTAQSYRNIGDYRKALALFDRAVQIGDELAQIYMGKARIHELLGEFGEARKYYLLGQELNPSDVTPYLALSRMHLAEHDYRSAEKVLQESLNSNDDQSSVLRMFGYIYAIQKRYDEGLKYAQLAVDENGTFFSYNILSWVMVAGESDIDSGITVAEMLIDNPPYVGSPFDLYVKESPFVPLPHHTAGLGYLKREEFDKALPYLKRAAELRPLDTKIKEDLATCRNRTPGST